MRAINPRVRIIAASGLGPSEAAKVAGVKHFLAEAVHRGILLRGGGRRECTPRKKSRGALAALELEQRALGRESTAKPRERAVRANHAMARAR